MRWEIRSKLLGFSGDSGKRRVPSVADRIATGSIVMLLSYNGRYLVVLEATDSNTSIVRQSAAEIGLGFPMIQRRRRP